MEEGFKLAQTYNGKICILLADGLGRRSQVHQLKPLHDALKGLGRMGDVIPALFGVCLLGLHLVLLSLGFPLLGG